MCSFFLDNFHSQLAGSLYGSLIVTYSISLNRPIRSMSDLFDDPIIQKLNLKQTLPVDLLSLRFIFVCSRVFFPSPPLKKQTKGNIAIITVPVRTTTQETNIFFVLLLFFSFVDIERAMI